MSCDRTSSRTSSVEKAAVATEKPLGHTWEQCDGQRESEAPLSELPEGLSFDDSFLEPIRHDAARGVLRYRGLMSHGSFRYLGSLSRDYRYQRALEQLFVATATPPAAGPAWKVLVIAAAAVIALLLIIGLAASRLAMHHSALPVLKTSPVTAGGHSGQSDGSSASPAASKAADQSKVQESRER